MRHDASEPVPPPGVLVVIDGEEGVWRVERHVTVDGVIRCRCFSYVDGRLVVPEPGAVHPCPDLRRAAP